MRIAVLGTGNVGEALGDGWARAGHQVIFGSRDPASWAQPVSNGKGTLVATIPEAVESSQVVALAIPWSAVTQFVPEIAGQLAGKIVIDCTNPARPATPSDGSAISAGEQVARLAPGARVVKSFNTTGFENMHNPVFPGGPATMFYAGDDPGAKKIVCVLAEDLGFDPVDAGPLVQSRALENLAYFWGVLAYSQKMGRGIAFRLLRR